MNIKSPPSDVTQGRPAFQKKKARRITPDYLHNAGLYYLQRFSASRHHFEEVLLRKVAKSLKDHPDLNAETCRDLVRETAEKFERSGLLDDEAYGRAMVASLRQQGKSKRFILSKLKHKGLAEDITMRKLEAYDENSNNVDGDLKAGLIFARKKKLGPFAGLRVAEPDKIMARMGRAGFSYGLSQKILKMDFEEADLILSGRQPV